MIGNANASQINDEIKPDDNSYMGQDVKLTALHGVETWGSELQLSFTNAGKTYQASDQPGQGVCSSCDIPLTPSAEAQGGKGSFRVCSCPFDCSS